MKIPLLINTCDKYQFLWELCLDRIRKHKLSEFASEIYINNEVLCSNLDVNFISNKRGVRNYPISKWISHLRSAVEIIDSEYVVVTQDDYLLTKDVDLDQMHIAIKILVASKDVSCVHLSQYVNSNQVLKNTENETDEFPELKFERYFLNMQIAIWRSRDLINALVGDGNPWRWELVGHKKLPHKYRILALPVQRVAVEYFAMIKKGGLLPQSRHYLTEYEYTELTKYIPIYKGGIIERFTTLYKAFLN